MSAQTQRPDRVSCLVSPVTGRLSAPASRSPIAAFPSPALTERDLVHLWEGQRFPREALRTRRGQRLQVLYRGRRTGGPGPDFRDAIIAGRDGPRPGDVELHVHSSDFRRHGHHADPAYDGLALHVVFYHDEPSDTRLACGRRVPVVALADWVEERVERIRRWLRRPVQWQEPCHSAVARLGGEATGEQLDRLGDLRFRQKSAAFAQRLAAGERMDQLLWEGLLEALAYGGDRAAFRLLAGRLPWAVLRRRLSALPAAERPHLARTLLFGAAADLPRGRPTGVAVRPGNRPGLRLEGAVTLACRLAGQGLLHRPLEALQRDPAAAQRALLGGLLAPGQIGRGRALEMLSNVLLPLAAGQGDEALARAAAAVYRQLPLPARYGAVRHLHEAAGPDVPVNLRRQQGMLHLLRGYCTQGGCGKCPLS